MKSIKIGMIGDVVGRPGRIMIKEHLKSLRDRFEIDFVCANYENASHGFGLTLKNCDELLGSGVDMMSGGNHSFDKKELISLFDTRPLLRPHNYPKQMPGSGVGIYNVCGVEIAIVNVMGNFSMPMADNPFLCAQRCVDELRESGVKHIVIDYHAEATSEKRALMMMLMGQVSAIVGTHTHVSTDDLHIASSSGYITDLGLTGCRDNVIGMDKSAPLKRFLTGLPATLDVPKKCKKILQIVLFELDSDGRCIDAKKIKVFDDNREFITDAWIEE